MTEKDYYKEYVLSPIYTYNNEIIRALYLPDNCYLVFKRNKDKWEEISQLNMVNGENTSLENINKYYNYPSDIIDPNLFNDLQSITDIGAVRLQQKLKITGDGNNQFLEAQDIIEELFNSLYTTMKLDIDFENDNITSEDIQYTTKELKKELGEPEKVIWDRIYQYNQKLIQDDIEPLKEDIKRNLIKGKAQRKTQQLLAKYLSSKYGIILRKHTGDIYKLDNKGYTYLTHDDLVLILKDDFGANLVHDEDIKKALGYISERLEPEHNIIKFNNCLFDMQKLEIIDPEKPIFTLIESKYNYNPKAESTILKNFLYSSLERPETEKIINGEKITITPEEATEQVVQGVKEVIGYFFTSGNKYNLFPVCTGVSGGGKSVFTNILTNIFGKDKIADLSLQEMEKNTHSTSSLANKHLNFIRDSDNTIIENNSFIKQLTGNEEIQINPKHKDPYILPKEEVPKTMMICNSIPLFKVYEQALIERLLIIEFLVKFRGTEKQDPELEEKILSNPEEIEWLIYESIQAFKQKEINKTQFILKITDEETRELIDKHTNPLNHIVRELILKHDPIAYETDISIDPKNNKPILTNDLADIVVIRANKLGLDIPLDRNKKQVSKRKLISVIKTEFDLWDGETVPVVRNGAEEFINRKYTTQTQKVNGESVRVYPNLIATELYYELLEQLESEKEQN